MDPRQVISATRLAEQAVAYADWHHQRKNLHAARDFLELANQAVPGRCGILRLWVLFTIRLEIGRGRRQFSRNRWRSLRRTRKSCLCTRPLASRHVTRLRLRSASSERSTWILMPRGHSVVSCISHAEQGLSAGGSPVSWTAPASAGGYSCSALPGKVPVSRWRSGNGCVRI
jgi:hypothetical protein